LANGFELFSGLNGSVFVDAAAAMGVPEEAQSALISVQNLCKWPSSGHALKGVNPNVLGK